MTRTGTDYLRGGIVRQWTITEIRVIQIEAEALRKLRFRLAKIAQEIA